MNKKIKLNLEYGFDRVKHPETPTNEEITKNYLMFAVRLSNEKGLTSDNRRLVNNIEEKIDEVIKSKAETVDLNVYEYTFLVKSFEQAVCPVNDSKNFTLVEKALLSAE